MQSKLEVIDCVQGTQEWLDHRKGLITASDFAKVVNSKGFLSNSKSMINLIYNVASGYFLESAIPSLSSSDMNRGNELEPFAREAYEQTTLQEVKEIGMFKFGCLGYSPDGLINDDGLIEIKCPKHNTHSKYLYSQSLPLEYKAQVLGGLAITDRKYCDFISYHPDFPDNLKMMIIRVERDEEYIHNLLTSLEEFNQKVLNVVKKLKDIKNESSF